MAEKVRELTSDPELRDQVEYVRCEEEFLSHVTKTAAKLIGKDYFNFLQNKSIKKTCGNYGHSSFLLKQTTRFRKGPATLYQLTAR